MDAWTFLLEQARLSWRRGGEKPIRVVAAVSGGADSAALLLALRELAKEEGFSLSAAHVNHGLRKEADGDAAFVSALCASLKVPCRVFRVHPEGKSENAAREARYAALLNGFPQDQSFCLALAHHQRDQAETVLLHLFRGSGGNGLRGMAEYSLRPLPDGRSALLWRPFLDVSPDLIRQALSQRGVSWREDSTNSEGDYLRNFLRLRVLPAVRERLPRAEEAVARAAWILSREQAYFQEAAEAFVQNNACRAGPCLWVLGTPLDALHPALRRHALRQACPVPLEWEQTEALMALRPGDTANLPQGWRAKRTRDRLHFLFPPGQTPPRPPLSPDSVLVLPFRGETGDGIRTQAVPKALFARCELRYAAAGDRIHPLGAPGSKSLQDYFVDRHVDQPFRTYMPLLCEGHRAVWAIGAGPGEEARVHPGEDAVLLRYEGFLPGETPGIHYTKGE